MSAPIDSDIWDYLKLVSAKLEEDSIANLYRENINSPMVNLMTHLLKNHRLRTTYDFEKAVARVLNKSGESGTNLEWNCNIMDKLGGRGTAASIVFELKKSGKFHGLKRRTQPANPTPKQTKYEQETNDRKYSCSPKFRIVKDETTGMAMSVVNNNGPCQSQSSVNVKAKGLKLGRNNIVPTSGALNGALSATPKRSRGGSSINSPLAGQGSIHKYLSRRPKQADGCSMSPSGISLSRKVVAGLGENSEAEFVSAQTNGQNYQLNTASSTKVEAKATSQD